MGAFRFLTLSMLICSAVHVETGLKSVEVGDQGRGVGSGSPGTVTDGIRALGQEVERLYNEWRKTRDSGALNQAVMSQRMVSR